MNYETVDPIFYAWAQRHTLQVLVECKDEVVRHVNIYSYEPSKRRDRTLFHYAGIGLLPPDPNQTIKVVVGSSPHRPSRLRRHKVFETALDTLDQVLEQAYQQAVEWLKEDEAS
jgi:hypothetical protein